MKNFSIVIITADRHERLLNCLDKLKYFEVYKEAEVVVVDASKEFFKLNYDFVKQIRVLPQHKGFSQQRNIGVKNSSYEYIVFIDDDVEITDRWFDEFVKKAQKKLLENKEIFGAMGAVFPKEMGFISFITGVLGHPGGGFKLHAYSKGKDIFLSQVATCNTVIKKSIIEELGGFDEANRYGSEDSEFCLRVIEKFGRNRFLYMPSVFVWHYSPNKIFDYIRWYIRRGISDADLLLSHKSHLSYFLRTSFLLKVLFVLTVSLITNIYVFVYVFFMWYLLVLYRARFMFDYFKYYDYKAGSKVFIFIIYPFFKAISDLSFDFGRLKRIL
ncbi:MAG: glycosyltransferase [Elusimicrobiota bacterium]